MRDTPEGLEPPEPPEPTAAQRVTAQTAEREGDETACEASSPDRTADETASQREQEQTAEPSASDSERWSGIQNQHRTAAPPVTAQQTPAAQPPAGRTQHDHHPTRARVAMHNRTQHSAAQEAHHTVYQAAPGTQLLGAMHRHAILQYMREHPVRAHATRQEVPVWGTRAMLWWRDPLA